MKSDFEKQESIAQQMELLDPKHEKVFQVKVTEHLADEQWDEAYSLLRDCVSLIPTSVYCHRRIVNIRNSTLEDKILYAKKCLKLSPRDPFCMTDLGIALRRNRDLIEAKRIFEQALKQPITGEGYGRGYVILQYGITLERLDQINEAYEQFEISCELSVADACRRLKESG